MTDYSKKSVLVVDNGLFVEQARMLGKAFGKVYYYSGWESSYPKTPPTLVGTGVEGVIRVNDMWQVVDDVDLFVFPDIYYGGLQEHLVSLGKRVWGSRTGDDIELKREESKIALQHMGIDIGPYKEVTGLDPLREYLKAHKDQYVKISTTRGDMETFHSKNYSMIEPVLDELEEHLGPYKKDMRFIVEQAIHDAVEIGYDGYTIDGRFPEKSMWGIEIKDKALLMGTGRYDELPQALRDVNEMMSPLLARYQYRGFMSTEVMATKDGKAYLIDPCMRCGSPPNELYQVLVTNWPDIMWEGADGVVVEPQFAAPWGAEVMLLSEWALKHWQPIAFPKEYRENVKILNLCVIDGKHYCVPQGHSTTAIGAVVALGDTAEDAISNAKKIAEKVEGYYIEKHPEALDEATEEQKKMESLP